ncbi:MAG TPA: ribosome small subunit-dependent GTPase A [Kineosporiaceae bacterium]|nr:ribosome small subunit-dependent GTPase A [Kineosporiaceae bacterium]
MKSVSDSHVFTSDDKNRRGVVIRVDRATAVVEDPDGAAEPVRATWGGSLLAAIAENPEAAPTTGDHVSLRFWPDERVTVDAVQPRRTLLTRANADGGSKRQVLAANVDTVAVVESLMPEPDLRRISRFLTLAWASGATPVVLLTKSDLVPDGPELAAQLRASSACPVIEVSVVSGVGIAQVRELLTEQRVMALLGASGAGKSSLVNALAGGPLMRVQELRKDGKGRHTTVTRELHRVAGGYLIDGPGLRGVGITGGVGLDLTFADVLIFAEACRFQDCAHEDEPGCAVLQAVDTGQLDLDRVEAWRQLVAEGYRQELRRDARVRAEKRRRPHRRA